MTVPLSAPVRSPGRQAAGALAGAQGGKRARERFIIVVRPVFAAILIMISSQSASSDPFRWMSFDAIDHACKLRKVEQFSKGLCWGFIFGVIDENLQSLYGKNARFCFGTSDIEKALDIVLSFVEEPKDRRTPAESVYGLAVLKAARASKTFPTEAGHCPN
jgi:hypothetical protein